MGKDLLKEALENHSSFFEILSEYQLIIKLISLILVLIIASFFIYLFYTSLSRRDLIKLNLGGYQYERRPVLKEVGAVLFYLLEYVVIAPLLIVFWFFGLSIFFVFIAEGASTYYILFICAGIVGATRVFSYFNEDIARDLAQLFPYFTLSIFLISPFNLNFDVILEKAIQIPSLLEEISYFLVVLFGIEFIFRLFHIFFVLKNGE